MPGGAEGTARPRSLAYRLKRALAIMALFYLAVVGMLYALQTKIIFPGASTQGQPDAIVVPPRGARLLELGSEGKPKIVALFGTALDKDRNPAADAANRPTILFFYGNGMCLADTLEEFEEFRSLGANVLIPDYLGYGLSGGEPSEAGCYATADAAYDWLIESSEVDPGKILVGGWSLGAAVATDLAVRKPVVGLMMLSPFTSTAQMAAVHYPFLPAGPLLKHRFENLKKIPQVKVPILIGHGTLDDIVPFEMSKRLAAAATAPVVHVEVPGAYHNDFMIVGRSRVHSELARRIAALGSQPDAQPAAAPSR